MTNEDERILGQRKDELALFAEEKGLSPAHGASVSRYQKTSGSQPRTVAATSLAAYRREGIRQLQRYIREEGLPIELVPGVMPDQLPSSVAWAKWLIRRGPELRSSTWRVYRRSLVQVLLEWSAPSSNVDEAIALLETGRDSLVLAEPKPRYSMKQANSEAAQTSSKRLRFISPFDLGTLLLECYTIGEKKSRTKELYLPGDSAGYSLADWLVAAISVGLKPCEWRQSRVVYVLPENEPVSGAPPKLEHSTSSGRRPRRRWTRLRNWRSIFGRQSDHFQRARGLQISRENFG